VEAGTKSIRMSISAVQFVMNLVLVVNFIENLPLDLAHVYRTFADNAFVRMFQKTQIIQISVTDSKVMLYDFLAVAKYANIQFVSVFVRYGF
jgi:hypothetical protein